MAKRLAANVTVTHRERYRDFAPAYWPERLQLLQPRRVRRPRPTITGQSDSPARRAGRGLDEVIAVNFMGDMFGPGVERDWQRACVMVMLAQGNRTDRMNPTYLLLTKNPQGMVEFAKTDALGKEAARAKHIWWGTSISCQEDDHRVTTLTLGLPLEARKWVSVEPMLGPVSLAAWTCRDLVQVVVAGPEKIGGRERRFELHWLECLQAECQPLSFLGLPQFWDKTNDSGEQSRPWGITAVERDAR